MDDVNGTTSPERFPDPTMIAAQVEQCIATAVREADAVGGVAGIAMLSRALSDLQAVIIEAYGYQSVLALDAERHSLNVVSAHLETVEHQVGEELNEAMIALDSTRQEPQS